MENINLILSTDHTTYLLFVFLCLIVCHALYSLFNRSDGNTAKRADMALSLGILGTFLGIVSGLLGFDVKDIQGSIPQLLAGLQYAFTTSIAGMFSSILIKLTAVNKTGPLSEATPESIQTELSKINVTLENSNKLRTEESNDLREEFKKMISGDNDTSLVNQFKLLKGDLISQLRENKDINASGFDNLERKFTELGESIAQLSSEAMVEALQKAIVEFNKQLADQLGENFKELNTGVTNLLEWQNQYKNTLGEMQDSINTLIGQLRNATGAIENISGSLEPIPETVKSIEDLFNNTETSIGLLLTTLESFENMRERAADAFPEIEGNLTRLTDNFTQTINGVGENLENMSNQFSESITENSENIRESLIESSQRLNETTERTREYLDESAERTRETLIESSQMIGDTLTESSQRLDEFAGHIDQSVTNSCNTIEVVGANLGAVSQSLSESIEENQQNLNQRIEESNRSLSESIEQSQQNMNQRIEDLSRSLSESITQNIQNAAQSSEALINETIAGLDQQMQAELTAAINALGTALASLSGKFVKDYEPLTASMSELISIGKQIRA